MEDCENSVHEIIVLDDDEYSNMFGEDIETRMKHVSLRDHDYMSPRKEMTQAGTDLQVRVKFVGKTVFFCILYVDFSKKDIILYAHYSNNLLTLNLQIKYLYMHSLPDTQNNASFLDSISRMRVT